MQDAQAIVSLDEPLEDDQRESLERMEDETALDPETVAAENSLTRAIEESLSRLDAREAEILRLRFGLGGGEARPLRAIAAEWRMSPEGVRQISERAFISFALHAERERVERVFGGRLEIGSWNEVGSWRLEIGDLKFEIWDFGILGILGFLFLGFEV